jgi:DnaK suppressor protein
MNESTRQAFLAGPLSRRELDRLFRLLNRREQALRRSLRELGSETTGTSAGGPAHDPETPAGTHLVELSELKTARERFANGVYGTCLECDGPIGYRRLEVQPEAIRCTACQTLWEKRKAASLSRRTR